MTQQSNTPETDEHISSNMAICGYAIVCHDFAMRLERERDEARRDLATSQIDYDKCAISLEDVTIERDQLRKVVDELAGSVKAEFGFDNWRLATYSQLPHVIARKGNK